MADESYLEGTSGSFSGLGLNKKAKKKNPNMPGLIQSQINMAQEKQPGALATVANNNGSLGTMDRGSMSEMDVMNKKKKKNGVIA